MEELAARFVARLEAGERDPDSLRVAGEAEPDRAAETFLAATRDPDLGPTLDRWAPALLRTARPGFAVQSLIELAQRRRGSGAPLDLGAMPALPLVLGSSNFLTRALLRHPEWCDGLHGAALADTATRPQPADWEAIRRTKTVGLLRITAHDLTGRPFVGALEELSALADHCLDAGLALAAAETGTPAPALFALGKLGGRELNFSSDVDVIFLYEPTPDRDELELNHDTARLVRHLKTQLETPTEEGFGYRVDLDLRPEGRTGALANSVEAALSYYESFGAEWERQMLIRLRYVAGPRGVDERFTPAIAPFVYRRLIDPSVMRSVRDMKARIEQERREAGRDLAADLKEGPGGIRDVEFLVQAFQLFYGAREPSLRTGNVLTALPALAAASLLPGGVATSLADAYTWLRRAEHALQLAEEQQTARFPRAARAQLELARRMGYADESGETARTRLLEDWTAVTGEVRAHFEALVLTEET